MKIGTDFELAVYVDGELAILPSILIGSKEAPVILECGALMHKDNAFLEIATPPVSTATQLINVINQSILQAQEYILSEYGMEVTLKAISGVEFDQKQLEADEENMVIGCNPSLSIYGKNPKPVLDKTYRSAGFHLHISPLTKPEMINFIAGCDLILGQASVALDEDRRRRATFGRAGEYRFKPSREGLIVEYRSLGAGVMKHKETIIDTFVHLYDMLKSGVVFAETDPTIINEYKEGDIVEAAKELVEVLKEEVRE